MGQSCTAGSRVLVQESIYEEFLPLLVRATQSIKVGDPLDETNFQGPQISKSQVNCGPLSEYELLIQFAVRSHNVLH